MKFRKKPVVIEAVQWTGEVGVYLPTWLMDKILKQEIVPQSTQLHIPTLEGTMSANKGDWIIQGINKEIYPCKPDIFEKTYEPV